MRHARRFIATLISFAIWCIASSAVAYAMRPDPPSFSGAAAPLPPPNPDTPLWKVVAIVAFAAFLTLAVVGLIASLRHARPSRPSRMLQA